MGMSHYHIVNGKIVDDWCVYDEAGAFSRRSSSARWARRTERGEIQAARPSRPEQDERHEEQSTFIGLGAWACRWASNLIKAGFQRDRLRSRHWPSAYALAALGGQVAATPAQAAARSDMSISMIMNDAILRVLFSDGTGGRARRRAGRGYVYAHLLDGLCAVASAEVARGRRAPQCQSATVCVEVAAASGLAESAGLSLFASCARAGSTNRCAPVFAAMAAKLEPCGRGRGRGLSQARAQHDPWGLIWPCWARRWPSASGAGWRSRRWWISWRPGLSGPGSSTLKASHLKERRFASPPSDIDTAAKDVDMILDTARKDAMPLPIMASVRQMIGECAGAWRGQTRYLFHPRGLRRGRRLKGEVYERFATDHHRHRALGVETLPRRQPAGRRARKQAEILPRCSMPGWRQARTSSTPPMSTPTGCRMPRRSCSEKTLGRWLKARGGSVDVVIATKGGHPRDGNLIPRLDRATVRQAVIRGGAPLSRPFAPRPFLPASRRSLDAGRGRDGRGGGPAPRGADPPLCLLELERPAHG